ncbi:MAG: helix-turn-helix domain-containing protein [Spirochaetia bacterium]|nr:helix-turn-helix domain-containing protein [Spirochaetia bacterium]
MHLIDTGIGQPTVRTVHPGSTLVLGFQYAGKIERAQENTWERLAPAGITGLQRVSQTFRDTEPTGSILAYVQPEDFSCLIPAHELTGRSLSLECLFPRSRLNQLQEQLQASGSVSDRFNLVRQLLGERRATGSSACLLAVDLIRKRARVTMKDLSKLTGISSRQLQRLFLNQIGMSPMEFARLVRFERTAQRLASGNTSAVEDYADQAHLIHDLKRRTGQTPGQFSKAQKMSLSYNS